MYALTVTEPPTIEPVDVARAKVHLRIDHDEEDLQIQTAIVAARKYAETHTGRFFMEQEVQIKLQGWPCDRVIRLEPFGPNEVQEVGDFTYLDAAGDEQDIAVDDYQTEFASNPPEISPAPNTYWPQLELGRRWPITLTLTVGVGTAAELDERVGQAILLTLGHWDEERGNESILLSNGLPPAAKRLLDSIWTGAY